MIKTGIDVGSKYVKAAVLNGKNGTGYGLSLIHRNVEKSIDEAVES